MERQNYLARHYAEKRHRKQTQTHGMCWNCDVQEKLIPPWVGKRLLRDLVFAIRASGRFGQDELERAVLADDFGQKQSNGISASPGRQCSHAVWFFTRYRMALDDNAVICPY
jgi:hypothetical protein